VFELAVACAALIGRALLQAADAALLAVGEAETRAMAAAPSSPISARLLADLKAHPEPTAAALRGISHVLLALAALASGRFAFALFSEAGAAQLPAGALAVATALVVGLLALVVDLAPRSLASARPMLWGQALAWPAWIVCRPLRAPLLLLLRLFDAALLRRGATARYTPPPPPLEQIERILSDEARAGGPAPPAEMVHGLFNFAERTAKEVMVPRTQVVGVPLGATPAQVIALLAEEGHTRMPVYDGSLDQIRGVLHTKDVIPLLAEPNLIVLQDLLRPPLFVPWTLRVGLVLREMQQKRSHLALVVDEFGGLAGIVSIEDILREIVGDLPDEHQEPEPALRLGADGIALLSAETRIEEINRAFDVELPADSGFETLAGLLNSCAGAIPQAGDRFFVNGLELTVAQRDDRRVRMVRVSRAPRSEPPPPA
jgi:CBS domain containing-hemolysin-like protein